MFTSTGGVHVRTREAAPLRAAVPPAAFHGRVREAGCAPRQFAAAVPSTVKILATAPWPAHPLPLGLGTRPRDDGKLDGSRRARARPRPRPCASSTRAATVPSRRNRGRLRGFALQWQRSCSRSTRSFARSSAKLKSLRGELRRAEAVPTRCSRIGGTVAAMPTVRCTRAVSRSLDGSRAAASSQPSSKFPPAATGTSPGHSPSTRPGPCWTRPATTGSTPWSTSHC